VPAVEGRRSLAAREQPRFKSLSCAGTTRTRLRDFTAGPFDSTQILKALMPGLRLRVTIPPPSCGPDAAPISARSTLARTLEGVLFRYQHLDRSGGTNNVTRLRAGPRFDLLQNGI
jgi:hypothetical protein